MNYNVSLAYEHCVVTVGIYDCPVAIEDEDHLVDIAISALETDIPLPRRLFKHYLRFHDVTIEEV
jgi:hypothetical protein